MSELTNISVMIGVTLIMTACGEPAFDANNQQIVTLEGKKYSVPSGTDYTREAVTPRMIHFYKSIGVEECQDGDITWEEKTIAEKINSIIRSGTKDSAIALYKKAASQGKIGCSHPLKT